MTFQSRMQRTFGCKNVAEDSRVSATDPYDLVTALFEELQEALGLMIESVRQGGDEFIFQYRANVQVILNDLDEKLNFEVTGDLAQTLRIMYNEAVKRIQLDGAEFCVERVDSAREMISEIQKAWAAIVTCD